MQTQNAIGNLIKRYKAVLRKCNILNTFGSLMLASGLLLSPMLVEEAKAKTNNTTITTGGFVASPGDSTLINNGNILGGYYFTEIYANDSLVGMYGSHTTGNIDYFFTNTGTIDISNISSVTSGAYAAANAYGMYADGQGNHRLTNYGDIIVRAEGRKADSNVAYAAANAYGMYADGQGNHRLTNYGDIIVRAEGGTADTNTYNAHAFAEAYGMSANGTGNHNLTNSGNITVTAQGGTAKTSDILNDPNAYANAYGMRANGTGSHSLTNSGDVTVTAKGGTADALGSGYPYAYANAYGMRASGIGNHRLTNYGDITVTAQGGTANSTAVYAYAYGMRASGEGNHRLTNYGDITVTAQGGTADSSADNVNAGADAYGMYAYGTGSHSLTNSGDITVTAQGGTANSNVAYAYANAYAYGMNADGTGNHNLTNSGDITVTAQGGKADFNAVGTNENAYADAYAYGMHAFGSGNHNLTNSGDITVTATGGKADSSADNASADAAAYGMRVNSIGIGNHNLTNSGNIIVTAQSGDATAQNNSNPSALATATGMYALGTGNHMTNSGHITVDAKGGNAEISGAGTSAIAHAFAYGMYVQGTPTAGGEHLINNYGIINATATAGTASGAGDKYAAAHAFEVFGYNSYSVGTFATTLQPWTITTGANGTADTVFGIQVGETINFKNTTLILRPQVTAQGLELGTTYDVSAMIAVANSDVNDDGAVQTATANEVTGNIASAIAEVPFLKATLTNGADPLSATVRLDANVNAHTSPGSVSAMQTLSQVQGQMSNIARELLQVSYNDIFTKLNTDTMGIGGGSEIEDSKWSAFLIPYANFFNNSEYGFDGNNVGFTGGASYRVNESFSLGAHFDFNVSDFDADSVNMTSDATSIAVGLHATYTITPEWYVRAQATFAHSQTDNDYKIANMAPLYADNTYYSNSLYLALNTGYVWQFAKNHSLTPEIGLSYLTTRSSAYDIEWDSAGTHMSMYDMHYDDTYYSAFYANFNLNWRSKWQIDDASSIALLAGLGIRQNLSGNEVKNDFYALNSRYSTTASEDLTTFLVDVGVEYKKDNFSVSLNYDGGFGTHQTSHGGNVMFKIEF